MNLRAIKHSKFKIQNFLTLSLLLLHTEFSFAQQPTPAPVQSKSILLIGATAHTGNGTVIANSAIGFKEGKIIFVAEADKADKSAYQEVIDVTGKHVYPGIIAPNSTLGLVEVESVRATRDMNDVGSYNPNLRSLIAYNTDSKVIPTVRTNGVLLVQVTPRGGVISGTSSVVTLDAWNWEDAALKTDDGIHLNWPGYYWRNPAADNPGAIEKSKTYEKQKAELTKFFTDSKAYNETTTNEEMNARFASMSGIFKGTQTLFVHAGNVKQISDAVIFCKTMSVKKMVIVGGQESWMLVDLLKENNIAVMVSRVHDLPVKTDDDIDLPYKLPYLLQKAGVLFCLNNEGDMETANARNMAFYAGTAVAYGLTKEEALASITSSTAKILGIDNRVGTIEAGKDATLFISTGDALDIRTNNVEKAFIQGRSIDLNNEQKALYEKYKKKNGL